MKRRQHIETQLELERTKAQTKKPMLNIWLALNRIAGWARNLHKLAFFKARPSSRLEITELDNS